MQTDAPFGKDAIRDSSDQNFLVVERAVRSVASNLDLLGTSIRRLQLPSLQLLGSDRLDACHRRVLREQCERIISAIVLPKDEPAARAGAALGGHGDGRAKVAKH